MTSRRLARPPRLARALAAVAVVFFCLPFVGLLWKTPWSRVLDVVGDAASRQALWLSLRTSLAAASLSMVFGVPLAWVLATTNFRGRNVVRALCLISMVLPPVVGGISLLFSLGRTGLFGRWLDDWFGFHFTFSAWGVIVAQVFVAMPFLVLTVEAALRSADQRHDEAARTLGATRWTTFRRVTVPAIRPALIAGTVLAWARALGEFGATITFAGNMPGRTQTAPLAVYLALESNPPQALVLSVVLVAISFIVLIALRDSWLGTGEERER